MSIYKFLCFTSLFYFSLADPVPTEPAAAKTQGPKSPDVQGQDALTAAIREFVKKYAKLMPAFSELEEPNQTYIEEELYDAMIGYINFFIFLIKQEAATDTKIGSAVYDNDTLFVFEKPADGSYLSGGKSDQSARKEKL